MATIATKLHNCDFSSSRDPRQKADMLAFRRGKLRRVNGWRGKRDARLHDRGKIRSRRGKVAEEKAIGLFTRSWTDWLDLHTERGM